MFGADIAGQRFVGTVESLGNMRTVILRLLMRGGFGLRYLRSYCFRYGFCLGILIDSQNCKYREFLE